MESCAKVANPRRSRQLAIGPQVDNLPHEAMRYVGE
jgi:hypothetical protein